MENLLLVHPYKHHSYYTMLGMQQYSVRSKAFYGYYNNGDFIDRMVSKTPLKSKLSGYYNSEIPINNIYTKADIKIKFLISKVNSKYIGSYINSFGNATKRYIEQADALHVLQDYCNISIREAYKRKIPIIYEQIQPYDEVQAEWLRIESDKENFNKGYISMCFPDGKLEAQQENLAMASAVIAASDVTKKSLQTFVSKPIYTFPYGADVSVCDEWKIKRINERRFKGGKLKVLYVGAINLIKGVRYIIEAASRLQKENFEFTFVGRPTYPEDRKLVDRILQLQNCHYIESVPHAQINSIYQKHDVFVFQGLCEGFGMVSLEAMANGLPCLLSEGACGVVTDSVDGYINTNCDVEQLIENLWKVHDNRELLNHMGENARKRVSECTWERFSNNIENVYRSEFG